MDAALGVAGALTFLHGQREPGEGGEGPAVPVLHRDVKSANIGFTRVGGSLHAKLLDCGLAKAVKGHDAAAAAAGAPMAGSSSTTSVVGTFGYMAPELTAKGASVQSEAVRTRGGRDCGLSSVCSSLRAHTRG